MPQRRHRITPLTNPCSMFPGWGSNSLPTVLTFPNFEASSTPFNQPSSMPPRKVPSKSEPKLKPDTVDEPPLQAVVLADSYNRRFEVLCADQPRVLLPLCSTPLLAWTLESLSLSRVKQVFVFCGVHAERIRESVA